MSAPGTDRLPDAVRPDVVMSRLHGRFTSPLRDERVAAALGVTLGVLFLTCAVTGAYSHLHQHPIAWLDIPTRPAGLYRVTQGIHVTAGFASIPVLLAKLWVVAPKLVEWPPARDARHLLERLLLVPLVGGGIFLLFSGVANVARWYPWEFFFPVGHYWAAWMVIGALIVHVGATWAVSRRVLRRGARAASTPRPIGPGVAGDGQDQRGDRRRFLGGVAATSGILAVGIAGGTVPWLSPFGFLSQRRRNGGPQGLPVNKTARQAKVLSTAVDPGWRLAVTGRVTTPLLLSRADLAAMPQRSAELPIACVEGWSESARWSGVPVRDILERAGAGPGAEVIVRSLEQRSRYATSELNRLQVDDPDTLLATHLDGERLHIDHGYPVRLIGPNRPGVGQTKWVSELEVR